MPDLHLIRFDPAKAKTYKGIKTFDCGNEMINTFLRKALKKRVKRHLSQAYILVDNDQICKGFYTLDTFSISRDIFETAQKPGGLPPVVPVIKLAMLGVDRSIQRRGIGSRLLRDAMLKTLNISEIAGCTGLFLLAEEEAVPFYKRLGFITLKEEKPQPIFLGIGTILDAV